VLDLPRYSSRDKPHGRRRERGFAQRLICVDCALKAGVASKQKSEFFSAMRTFVNPASINFSPSPFFCWPEWRVKATATRPPGFITRCNSRSPASASVQTCSELIAIALSKLPTLNGRASAAPSRRSTWPLNIALAFRTLAWSSISLDASMPNTYPPDAACARSSIPTPGPKPTSNTLSLVSTSNNPTTQQPNNPGGTRPISARHDEAANFTENARRTPKRFQQEVM
jgi:hypothetical protein